MSRLNNSVLMPVRKSSALGNPEWTELAEPEPGDSMKLSHRHDLKCSPVQREDRARALSGTLLGLNQGCASHWLGELGQIASLSETQLRMGVTKLSHWVVAQMRHNDR